MAPDDSDGDRSRPLNWCSRGCENAKRWDMVRAPGMRWSRATKIPPTAGKIAVASAWGIRFPLCLLSHRNVVVYTLVSRRTGQANQAAEKLRSSNPSQLAFRTTYSSVDFPGNLQAGISTTATSCRKRPQTASRWMARRGNNPLVAAAAADAGLAEGGPHPSPGDPYESTESRNESLAQSVGLPWGGVGSNSTPLSSLAPAPAAAVRSSSRRRTTLGAAPPSCFLFSFRGSRV